MHDETVSLHSRSEIDKSKDDEYRFPQFENKPKKVKEEAKAPIDNAMNIKDLNNIQDWTGQRHRGKTYIKMAPTVSGKSAKKHKPKQIRLRRSKSADMSENYTNVIEIVTEKMQLQNKM